MLVTAITTFCPQLHALRNDAACFLLFNLNLFLKGHIAFYSLSQRDKVTNTRDTRFTYNSGEMIAK